MVMNGDESQCLTLGDLRRLALPDDTPVVLGGRLQFHPVRRAEARTATVVRPSLELACAWSPPETWWRTPPGGESVRHGSPRGTCRVVELCTALRFPVVGAG